MLATLYDLEVIEEYAVKDWKMPPDNRHPFLMAAREAFTMNQRLEAVKQVCKHVRVHVSMEKFVESHFGNCCIKQMAGHNPRRFHVHALLLLPR
jgi:hypothetical protein